MRAHRGDPWKSVLVGMIGGAAGTLAMSGYWRCLEFAGAEKVAEKENPELGPLGDLAVLEKQTKRGEKSTEAVGRMAYETLAGHQPRAKETRTLLGEIVHWSYGTIQGAIYAVARGKARPPDLAGGAVFGSVLWLVSMLGLPLGGFGKGPTAFPLSRHAAEGGAHLIYGLSAAAVIQLLLHRV